MTVEIRVPALGESITEATVGQWLKKRGDAVKADEPLVELETDKVTVEVPAPAAGVLDEIRVDKGATVAVGAILGALREAATERELAATVSPPPAAPPPAPERAVSPPSATGTPAPASPARPEAAPHGSPAAPRTNGGGVAPQAGAGMPPSPAARKALAEVGIEAGAVEGSGRRGQVLKHDVEAARQAVPTAPQPAASGVLPPPSREAVVPAQAKAPGVTPTAVPEVEDLFAGGAAPAAARTLRLPPPPVDAAREERVKMTRLRQTIARRLKEAQNTAAMLTTFNDVDMSTVLKLRADYKDLFEKRHGVKLGFMGFFVKACVQALKEIPEVNAEIDGGDIVYKNYYHIGVAVGTDKGLVVPVLRDADRLSLAEIELAIANFGRRAREGKLGIEDMQGGTFTISNGGVFGSLLSTPILNAPQSGILGMHRIEERPVVRNGKIEARPMMYLALSYDHRLVDGREAVTFLVRVKEGIEDPQRFMLEL